MKGHCCKIMTQKINHACAQHPDPFSCPDHLIYYIEKFHEYAIIIHDGGSSFVLIFHCPWCGAKLPESQRGRWFEELKKRGFENPASQEIPAPFETDEWMRQCL